MKRIFTEPRIIIYAIVCIVLMTLLFIYDGTQSKADDRIFKSSGRFVYDNGTEDTSDDVVFDASDFDYLYDLALAPYTPQ